MVLGGHAAWSAGGALRVTGNGTPDGSVRSGEEGTAPGVEGDTGGVPASAAASG